ncbi:RNA-binding transcriptional accessory protein [bacterium]|nr:RNA-binding transcriptional accessory protein [bacterium]
MAEYINEDLIKEVASTLNIKEYQVKAVLDLLSEGGTIPFIARYRKEVTGSLDEEQIRAISKEYEYGLALNKRKEDIIRLIDEKGLLTDELKAEIEAATKLITLEDIYRPFKEKKKTKATEAIKNGLEPLAKLILSFPMDIDIIEEAKKYINENVPDADKALEGAKFIIAEIISDNKDYREYIREDILERGFISSAKKKNAVDERETYKDYYEYRERIQFQKSFRVLALNRAETEKVITVTIEPDKEKHIRYLNRKNIKKPESPVSYLVEEAILDSYDRLIFPSIEREVRNILTEKAEDNAIKLFGDNLEHLLLSAPLKGMNVLGVDPSFRTGCKIAALDKTGKVLGKDVIYQNQKFPDEKVPESRIQEAELKIRKFVKLFNIDIISIGNGTASRETEKFIADTIRKYDLPCKYIITSEAGASVYSASKIAQEEFPDYHVEERSAVSIGRRIQDPLAELVKIDPQSIGVGQYQHDVTQSKLKDTLDFVVEKAVNQIGVNINTASKSLLQYVSGLNKATASTIVEYREENGEFKNRREIKKVPKIGDKAFEQCVGFLRIPESSNPLDKTSIHPESYDIAEKVLKYLGFTKEDLGSKALIDKIDKTSLDEISKALDINPITLEDILKAFVAPMRDPRDELPQPILKSDVLHLEDLRPNMELEGTVRNITDFGAFIDLGVKESGLVHISQMSTKRIKHPSEILKVGQIVKTYVISVDLDRRRIALSLLKPNEQ